jgi:hypothetical protein
MNGFACIAKHRLRKTATGSIGADPHNIASQRVNGSIDALLGAFNSL